MEDLKEQVSDKTKTAYDWMIPKNKKLLGKVSKNYTDEVVARLDALEKGDEQTAVEVLTREGFTIQPLDDGNF